jgi:hypothetical protein
MNYQDRGFTNLEETLRLIGTYTAGRYDLWVLAGNAKASVRAHIMSVLLGKKTPQAKSGVNALQSELYKQLGIPEKECSAVREDWFRAICRFCSPYECDFYVIRSLSKAYDEEGFPTEELNAAVSNG